MKNNQTWLTATLKSLVDTERMTEYERTNILGIDTALRKRVEDLEGVAEKARRVVRALEEEWVEEEWRQEDIELRDALAKLKESE